MGPTNPFTELTGTGTVAVVPRPTTTFPGLEMMKPGAAIASGNEAVAVTFPDMPVIVTTLVPTGADPVAEIVKTELPVAGFGEKLAVTPLGKPDTDRLIAPRNPYDSDMGTGVLTVDPWPTVMLPGLEMVKLGALIDSGKVVVEVCFPEVPVIVTSVVPGAAELLETSDKEEFPFAGFGEM